MFELLLLALAAGAVVLAYKTGVETTRKQVLDDFTQRIAGQLKDGTDFANKYGVRGGFLSVDHFAEGSKSGTGYNSFVDGSFVVVERDDFKNLVARASGRADFE